MNESDIDKIAQKIFSLVIEYNKNPNIRKLKIQENYKLYEGKLFFIQILWEDHIKSSHLIAAQIQRDNLDEAEFFAHKKQITVKTKDLLLKFKQALAEIPKN